MRRLQRLFCAVNLVGVISAYNPSLTPLQRSFAQTGVAYRKSVLSPQEFQDLKSQVSGVTLVDEKSSIAHNRIGAVLSSSKVIDIFEIGGLHSLVTRVVGQDYVLSTDVPIELRVYEKTGAGVNWHVDEVLYNPPQVEVVYTIENTSDCTTQWNKGTKVCKEETEANSVLLLRAGGPSHCVTPLKRGRRVIIKCVYIQKDAEFIAAKDLIVQFSNNKKRIKKKKQQRKR